MSLIALSFRDQRQLDTYSDRQANVHTHSHRHGHLDAQTDGIVGILPLGARMPNIVRTSVGVRAPKREVAWRGRLCALLWASGCPAVCALSIMPVHALPSGPAFMERGQEQSALFRAHVREERGAPPVAMGIHLPWASSCPQCSHITRRCPFGHPVAQNHPRARRQDDRGVRERSVPNVRLFLALTWSPSRRGRVASAPLGG